MKDSELIELARAYVALSNAHRFDLIMSMFAAGADYVSDAVGEHHGRAAIGDMMHAYNADYDDVYWHAEAFECNAQRVSFRFEMTATSANGGKLQRRGLEHIDFTADGSIKKITVETD